MSRFCNVHKLSTHSVEMRGYYINVPSSSMCILCEEFILCSFYIVIF